MSIKMNNTQEYLFNEIILTAARVNDLKAHVQNDFDRLIQDGYLSKEQLLEGCANISEQFDTTIKELFKLKFGVLKYIKDYCNLADALVFTAGFEEQKRDEQQSQSV